MLPFALLRERICYYCILFIILFYLFYFILFYFIYFFSEFTTNSKKEPPRQTQSHPEGRIGEGRDVRRHQGKRRPPLPTKGRERGKIVYHADEQDTSKAPCILIYVVFRATLHECLSVSLRFWRSQAEGFLSYFF